MKVLRLFFAVWPPEELRERLWQALSPLRRSRPGVRWVPPDRFHITLRFLGDVSERMVSSLTGAADVLAPEPPFRVEITGTGVFPPHGNPARIYWVGVTAAPIMRIRSLLDAALAREGMARERRAFTPHLTVGRARPGRHRMESSGAPSGPAAAALAGEGFTVNALHLVRSELFPGGPRYANIHRVLLTGRQGVAERWAKQ